MTAISAVFSRNLTEFRAFKRALLIAFPPGSGSLGSTSRQRRAQRRLCTSLAIAASRRAPSRSRTCLPSGLAGCSTVQTAPLPAGRCCYGPILGNDLLHSSAPRVARSSLETVIPQVACHPEARLSGRRTPVFRLSQGAATAAQPARGAPAPCFLRTMKRVLHPEERVQDDRRVCWVVGNRMTQVSYSPNQRRAHFPLDKRPPV